MFNVTRKTDPSFQALSESLANVKTIEQFNYNALGGAYNDLALGEIVDFPFTRDKQTSLIQQMQRRGLTRNVDYRLVLDDAETDEIAVNEDGSQQVTEETGELVHTTVETAFITRLTAKEAEMVTKRRGGETQQGGAQVTTTPIPAATTTVPVVVTEPSAPAAPAATKPAAAAPAKAPAKPAAAPPKPTGKPPAKPTRR